MSDFGSFTARFTVMEGTPAKADFNASELNLLPNTPPWPTDTIQAFEHNSIRFFNFFFKPALPNGKHELEGGKNETAFFNENGFGYTTVKSLVKIEINSLAGTYTGTFQIELLDRAQRKVIADGEFDLKVVPN
ncbi:hypothetical protein [Pseudomonas sp. PB106]|uniref:hypothetical protein n=1 Tax=Pseudomonas sp. PB106 TaxID=2494699 RepID=UPI00131DF257|nr:hypothetical protein [Pseudomonas sp. PB106]KAE9646500.1 hypothetical protein EJA71_09220 [Pseudomonas sp. PB106]